jgi:hypothetical protein
MSLTQVAQQVADSKEYTEQMRTVAPEFFNMHLLMFNELSNYSRFMRKFCDLETLHALVMGIVTNPELEPKTAINALL